MNNSLKKKIENIQVNQAKTATAPDFLKIQNIYLILDTLILLSIDFHRKPKAVINQSQRLSSARQHICLNIKIHFWSSIHDDDI